MSASSTSPTPTFDVPPELYFVVKNEEEQYSIWPDYKPIPDGWEAEGEARAKEDCLDHIERVWTDMRPKSLRERMAQRVAETSKPSVKPKRSSKAKRQRS